MYRVFDSENLSWGDAKRTRYDDETNQTSEIETKAWTGSLISFDESEFDSDWGLKTAICISAPLR
jgi:hypothetical protein